MKRAHKARAAMIDAKNIENSGTDAIDQCEGLPTASTTNATYATSSLGSRPVKSRSEPFKADETTSYNKPVDAVISNPPYRTVLFNSVRFPSGKGRGTSTEILEAPAHRQGNWGRRRGRRPGGDALMSAVKKRWVKVRGGHEPSRWPTTFFCSKGDCYDNSRLLEKAVGSQREY